MSPQPTDPPATWWSETEGVIVEAEIGGYTTYGWHPQRFTDLPADAVRLVPERPKADIDRAIDTITSHNNALIRTNDELRAKRAAVLAYLDDCDHSLAPVDADEIRNRLGVGSDG